MSCFETILDYSFRSLGFGPRALPKSDFSLCLQFTLIGSGLLWNLYFGLLALFSGFFFSIIVALSSLSNKKTVAYPAKGFILFFRGSPLFIQFFLAYFIFLTMKKSLGLPAFFTSAWFGALFVLFLNTSAYSAHIFSKAIEAVPHGEIEAGKAFGFDSWKLFIRITMPSMLRLAWPSYTNEAIFLFHATTLVFFSAFPTWQQRGDALYYANYFADKTFNPFISYPILASYFILLTSLLILIFSIANRRLNRHLPKAKKHRLTMKFNFIR